MIEWTMESIPAYILVAPVTDSNEEYRAIVTTDQKGQPLGLMEIQQYVDGGWTNVDWLYMNTDSLLASAGSKFQSWLSRRNVKENI